MNVALIAAIGKNRELGRGNQLLWKLHSDMVFFKQTTLDHWVIMGRKSFESLPPKFRPLPQRTNVVITRDRNFTHEGTLVFHNIHEALSAASEAHQNKVFIIGGGEIYSQSLASNCIDEMYLTHVDAAFSDADVWFPNFDSTSWKSEVLNQFTADASNEHAGVISHYVRI
jgi:dihydrofolate reductase